MTLYATSRAGSGTGLLENNRHTTKLCLHGKDAGLLCVPVALKPGVLLVIPFRCLALGLALEKDPKPRLWKLTTKL